MLFLNLVVALAVGQSQGVTVELPAQSLEALMPKLAQATGQSLTVGNLMAKDVLLVRVKDAPVDELIANIAKVTGGIWVQAGGGLRLDRDMQLEAREIQEATAERAVVLKAEIDKLVADSAKLPKFDPSQLRESAEQFREQFQNPQQNQGDNRPRLMGGLQGMQNAMPAGRAIIQTLSSMRAEDLAKIGPNQRAVFSSRPTAMQKPLPGNALTILANFMADQNKLTSAFDQFRQQRENRPVPSQPQAAQRNQQARVAVKSFLIVTRNGNAPGLNLTYIAADANGQNVGSGNLNLGQTMNVPPAPEQSGSAGSAGTEIKFSDQSKAAAELLGRSQFGMGGPRGGGGGNGGTPISPELLKLLRDPVTNDPLSFHVEEALLSMVGDKNVVALVPDNLAGNIGRALRGKATVESLQASAKSNWNLVFEEAGNWTTIAPKRKVEARLERVDRVALKSLMDAIATKGSARLDDVAKYAQRAPAVNSGGIDLAIVRAVDPGSAQTVNQVYGQDREVLVLYGTLNPAVKQNLLNGHKANVSTVGPNSLSLVASMVFNSQDGPTVVSQNPGTAQVQIAPGGPGRGPGGGRGGNRSMASERTEILPQGVPSNALVTLVVNSNQVAKAVNNSSGASRLYSSQAMAGERAMAEAPAPQNNDGRNQRPPTMTWDGYVPGVQTSYTFVFELAPGIALTRRLEDTTFAANAKAVNFNSLPTEFQNSVTQRYEEMKARNAERQANGGRQQQGRQQGRRGSRRGQIPPGP